MTGLATFLAKCRSQHDSACPWEAFFIRDMCFPYMDRFNPPNSDGPAFPLKLR
jgi:hypothetical protein